MPGLGVGDGTSRLWMRFVKKPENRFPARFYLDKISTTGIPDLANGKLTSGRVEGLRGERGSLGDIGVRGGRGEVGGRWTSIDAGAS